MIYSRRSLKKRTTSWLFLIGALVLIVHSLLPFYWMISVAITPEQGLFARDARLVPSDITLENFIGLFEVLPFAIYLRNSVIIAVGTTLLSLSVVIPASYAFARFRFLGQKFLVRGMLLLYMIPPVVLLVPLIVIFRRLGLTNTFPGLILAESTLTIPFATWLLINYFSALPRELEDAALIDGCSPIGALLRIVLPLALPGVVAAGLFVFIVTWNEFLFAFMFASNEAVRTLPVLMRSFVRGESGIFWGTIMASATLTTLPVAVLFLYFQKYLIGGLSAGAVKG